MPRRYASSLIVAQRTAKAPKALVRAVPKKYKPKYKLTQPMRKEVKKIVNKMEETNEKQKVAFGAGSGSNYDNKDFPGIPQGSNDIIRLIPTVDQGVERDQREGAKIRMTNISATFFAHIPAALTPATPAENSAVAGIQCRLLILSCKQVQAVGQLESNWNAGQLFNRQFLKNGSEATGFNGDLWSLRWPVNTQLFTKHYDKYFTLKRGYVRGDTANGAITTPEVAFTHNFRIKCKNKILQFNEPSTTEHTNWSLFGLLLYANNDSSLTNGSPGPVKGNMFTRINWKEA